MFVLLLVQSFPSERHFLKDECDLRKVTLFVARKCCCVGEAHRYSFVAQDALKENKVRLEWVLVQNGLDAVEFARLFSRRCFLQHVAPPILPMGPGHISGWVIDSKSLYPLLGKSPADGC